MRKAYKEQKGDAEVTRGLLAAGSEVKAPETTGAEGMLLGILPSKAIGYYHAAIVSGRADNCSFFVIWASPRNAAARS